MLLAIVGANLFALYTIFLRGMILQFDKTIFGASLLYDGHSLVLIWTKIAKWRDFNVYWQNVVDYQFNTNQFQDWIEFFHFFV